MRDKPYEPYKMDALKTLMQRCFMAGMYPFRQELLKISMQGEFEGWSGRATEDWENRFYVEFRIPTGDKATEDPGFLFKADARTLEDACQSILRQLKEKEATGAKERAEGQLEGVAAEQARTSTSTT